MGNVDIKTARGSDANFDGSVTVEELQAQRQELEAKVLRFQEQGKAEWEIAGVQEKINEVTAFEQNPLVGSSGTWRYFNAFQADANPDNLVSDEEFQEFEVGLRKRIIEADGAGRLSSNGYTTLPELLSNDRDATRFFEYEIDALKDFDYELIEDQVEAREIIEVDIPSEEGVYGNPEFVMDQNYEIIFSYRQIYGRSDYEGLLKSAGLTETVDDKGVYHFSRDGKAVNRFEGYTELAFEKFVADELGSEVSHEDKQALKQLLSDQGFIPVVGKQVLRCPGGPRDVMLYDTKNQERLWVQVNNSQKCMDTPRPEDYLLSLKPKDQK